MLSWYVSDNLVHMYCGEVQRTNCKHGRYGGSWDMWWLMEYVVAHGRCGGSWDMWWLREDVVTHCRWCGSWDMW